MADSLATRLVQALGAEAVVTDPSGMAAYSADWRGVYLGRPRLVARPGSAAEAAQVVRLCREAGAPVVPQGGNTGLCGGSVPDSSARQVVVATDRMRSIRAVDVANRTVTVDAGVVLATVQQAARSHGLLFPLSLGAEGSCTIGGNIATNAGGTAVLRYGSMRELVLGLEVVLPDGRVWDGLRGLRKDNTGYDMKQVFIGSEGTLGIVTGAVLRLFPRLRRRATAWVGLPWLENAVTLLRAAETSAGDRLVGFEVMSAESLQLVLAQRQGARDPLDGPHRWYGLVELGDSDPDLDLDARLATVLAGAVESGTADDAVVASGPGQRQALWALREGISEAQAAAGPSLKHDVSVPVSALAEFVRRTDDALRRALPGLRIVSYGHVGDGNMHYNLSKPAASDDRDFLSIAPQLTRIVYDNVSSLAGSISAEHGLGVAKRDAVAAHLDPVEVDLMRAVKRALDPAGLMNPGKVLPDEP